MIQARYNICLIRNASFTNQIDLEDGYGNPLDLTGYTVTSDIKSSYTDISPAASFSVSVTPTSGSLVLSLDSDTTAILTDSAYVYDLKLEVSGTIERPLVGKVLVSPAVTS